MSEGVNGPRPLWMGAGASSSADDAERTKQREGDKVFDTSKECIPKTPDAIGSDVNARSHGLAQDAAASKIQAVWREKSAKRKHPYEAPVLLSQHVLMYSASV